MRHKYLISRNLSKNRLEIREYAIIDKDLKRVAFSEIQKEHFSLLCEESYEHDEVVRGIDQGLSALVAILRTDNIFPIRPYATKIAETVKALYDVAEEDSAELLFDDIELVSA
ncbi:hypothetical protein DSCO28_50190 [Desulfosarcina ovata subsp. sediminis]|uniref:Uncharacterized protein n=1 Tax=Desulfosarcina ovata subsp. sediminis TaxID=885957 RepID=A0A5K7ZW22_9BACT|nr:hypothetical protein [Desulfosarcina ovata]BBO84453.1 hypothetical protein DSCO28_50190 [Desulfosarcina ovata subsp. sediminis]